MLPKQIHCEERTRMAHEVSRRGFLLGAEAVLIAGALSRAYANATPESLATDEDYWKQIRNAYGRDPKLVNLNNGGVAPQRPCWTRRSKPSATATNFPRTACGMTSSRKSRR